MTASAGVGDNGEVVIGRAGGTPRLADAAVDGPLLVAIDTPYQVFDEAGSLVHVAAWTPEGQPADGAEVYLADHFVGRTDGTGTLAFRWGVPGNEVEDYWLGGSAVQVRWRDDDRVLGGSVWFSAFSRTESFESDHLFVYTDRGVYAPGDSLNARLIGWHLAADYAPIDGGEVELVLVSPSEETITGTRATTDAFGTAFAGLELPDTLPDGAYRLDVSYAGATASTRLRVERFVAPVLRIDHDLGRFVTRDAETLPFAVELSYFAGGYPARASIALDVIARGEVRHSEERGVLGRGPHAFELDAATLAAVLGGLADRETIAIRLTVEDEQGRVDRLTRDMTYAIDPYVAVIEADRDAWSEGDPIELIVRLTDVERVPLRNAAIRLVTDMGRVIETSTDDSGTAQISLVMGGRGFEVALFVDGVDAAVATRWLEWQEPQPMRSHIADAIVRENEPTHVRVSFPSSFRPVERVVHMDVTDVSGSLVEAVLLPIRQVDGEWIAEGEFAAPSWGSMLLTFFCLGEEPGQERIDPLVEGPTSALGLLTEGQNLAVHPGRELTITLDGVPDTLAPGEAFAGRIVVRTPDGRPADAAVGVAMVDEAVISLRDPLEITPMDHFYNPELRVLSTTGSAILTWPVVSRNWGYETHDIALPPFPYKPGGPIQGGSGPVSLLESEDEGQMGSSGVGEYGATGGASVGGVAGFGSGSGTGYASASPVQVTASLAAPAAQEAAPADGTVARGRASRDDSAAQPPVTITIRTEPPRTAMWLPSLRAESGSARFEGMVPDAIARQQLSIVASDARGGVGVLRASIDVTRALSVRSDLPPTVVRGEPFEARVAVTNRTSAPQQVTLSLAAPALELESSETLLTVEPGTTAVARFAALAPHAGDVAFEVRGAAGALSDGLAGTLRVLPAGTVAEVVRVGNPGPDTPWALALDGGVSRSTDAGAVEWREATLSLVFPAVSSAFAGMDRLVERLASEPVEALASDLVTAFLVYERQRDAQPAGAAELRERLQAAVARVEEVQQDDGGWRAWWAETSSVYLSAWCLEALTEARRLDFAVDPEGFAAAVTFLSGRLEAGTLDLSSTAFWEGDDAAVERGVRLEALHALARVPAAWLDADALGRLSPLWATAREVAEGSTDDVTALAHAVGALAALRADGRALVSDEALGAAATRLARAGREGHWEPSWFSAYGGTIEATVTTLEVLRALPDAMVGDARARAEREAIRYLMSTSEALGSWHNERGSAWLIRALVLVAADGPQQAGTVRVLLDGEELVRVEVDPDDPYGSALRLRQIDLSEAVREGARSLSVEYDGVPAPRAEVIERVWTR